MNARDRIAQVLADTEKEGATDTANSADDEYRILADAVLAVLPGLLTDPDIVAAAASELRRWEVEAVAGINYEATPSVTRQVLAAAARALTGGDT